MTYWRLKLGLSHREVGFVWWSYLTPGSPFLRSPGFWYIWRDYAIETAHILFRKQPLLRKVSRKIPTLHDRRTAKNTLTVSAEKLDFRHAVGLAVMAIIMLWFRFSGKCLGMVSNEQGGKSWQAFGQRKKCLSLGMYLLIHDKKSFCTCYVYFIMHV